MQRSYLLTISLMSLPFFGLCGQDCDPPTALFTIDASDPAQVCPGTAVTFDGSASTAMADASVVLWIWSDGSGLDSTTVPTYSRTYDEGGIYPMRLRVVDDAGCGSAPSEMRPVFVSPPAFFGDHTVPGSACSGNPLTLNTTPTQAPLQLVPGAGWGSEEPTLLPDDVGNPLVLQTTWHVSDTAAIITDPAQLGDICLDIEHSSIGDLRIQLTCPNGSSVYLHNQGGGSITTLGFANDSNTFTDIPGVCATYCFNTNPEFETLAMSSQSGLSPNVVPIDGGLYMLIPGSYTSVGSLNSLVGCPVNGTWTMTFTDLWGADNGFLCSWSITPQIDDLVIDPPVLGTAHADSSIWSGPGVSATTEAPNTVIATTNLDGPQQYSYAVQDSYGCWTDTLFTVQVLSGLAIDAGQDTALCAGPVQLGASFSTAAGPVECGYQLVLRDEGNTIWGGARVLVVMDNWSREFDFPWTGVDTIIPLDCSGATQLSVYYMRAQPVNNYGNRVILLDPMGNTLVNVINALTSLLYDGPVSCGIPGLSYSWSPAESVYHGQTLHPWVLPTTSTDYTVTATIAGNAGCSVSDQLSVGLSQYPQLSLYYDADQMAVCTDATGFTSYSWFNQQTNQTNTTTTPCVAVPPLFNGHIRSLIATDTDGCIAYSDTLVNCPVVTFTYNGGQFQQLVVNSGHSQYAWTFNGDPIVAGSSSIQLLPYGPGVFTVTITTNYGCVVTGTYYHLVTGVGDARSVSSFSVRPSPNMGSFDVVLPANAGTYAQMRLVDAAGRTVQSRSISAQDAGGTIRVDSALPPGIYVVELIGPDASIRQRMVVEQ